MLRAAPLVLSAQAFAQDGIVPGDTVTAPVTRPAAPQTAADKSAVSARPAASARRAASARPAASAQSTASGSSAAAGPPVIRIEPPARGGAAPVVSSTTIDRSAAWVGEPFAYEITFTCPPGTDILAADISRDRLRLHNLDVLDAKESRAAGENGAVVYRARFRLAGYSVGAASIEAQQVRYYVHTAGQPPDTLVPADEVQLPAATIAIRSSLNDSGVTWLRGDTKPASRLPVVLEYLTPAGAGVLLVGVALLLLGAISWMRVRAPRRAGPPRRQVSAYRARIDDIRQLDRSGDVESRRTALAQVGELIRDRLMDLEIPANGLTPDELQHAVAGRAAIEQTGIIKTLRESELALYGGAENPPAAASLDEALASLERLLAVRAR